jgi:hypothetical protein
VNEPAEPLPVTVVPTPSTATTPETWVTWKYESGLKKTPNTAASGAVVDTFSVLRGPGITTSAFGSADGATVFTRSPSDTVAASPGEHPLPGAGPARFASVNGYGDPSTSNVTAPGTPPAANASCICTDPTGIAKVNV